MDLASNPIAALRLDDMSEHYVGIPLTKKDSTTWEVPNDVFPSSGLEVEQIKIAHLENATFDNAAIISKDNGCQEFIIGISKYSKCIRYARVGWLDYRHSFEIRDWLFNQSINEIIEKVREDFNAQCQTLDGKKIDSLLRGENSPNVADE